MSEAIPRALRERVAEEARHRCGYCLTDQGVSGAQMHIKRLWGPQAPRPEDTSDLA